jgi:hypothetical protein
LKGWATFSVTARSSENAGQLYTNPESRLFNENNKYNIWCEVYIGHL